MPAFQLFTIRFSRAIHNAEEDDVINIKPRWNEISEDCKMLEYVVRHKVASCAGSEKSEQVVFGSNLQNYIGNLIDILTVDIQPFKQIQFDFPCMPTVVVTPDQLPSIRHAIMSTTYIIQNNWPTVVVKKAKSRPLNPYAEAFVPESLRAAQRRDTASYQTPQRVTSRNASPPKVQRQVPRHIFFDEEDGHVTRYFN